MFFFKTDHQKHHHKHVVLLSAFANHCRAAPYTCRTTMQRKCEKKGFLDPPEASSCRVPRGGPRGHGYGPGRGHARGRHPHQRLVSPEKPRAVPLHKAGQQPFQTCCSPPTDAAAGIAGRRSAMWMQSGIPEAVPAPGLHHTQSQGRLSFVGSAPACVTERFSNIPLPAAASCCWDRRAPLSCPDSK